jgi:alkanesulfonate monooxygenase SsuD/methylene tetrahydromethanopterin reductase-like flavin-dependent oxidoreductase (luciferase family)
VDIALMRYLFVARNAAQARGIAGTPFIRAFEHTYFKWPHPVVKRPPGELTIERLAEDRIILGDPESCLRQLERFRDELGLGHIICRLSVRGIPADAARESVDLFTREIMPALQ